MRQYFKLIIIVQTVIIIAMGIGFLRCSSAVDEAIETNNVLREHLNWRLDHEAQLESIHSQELEILREEYESYIMYKDYSEDIEAQMISMEVKLAALEEFYERTTGYPVLEVKEATFHATRYTNAEGWWENTDPNYGRMANGLMTSRGAVAMPRNIPFDSTVLITQESPFGEHNEIFTVGDRGGAIKALSDDWLGLDIWTPESEYMTIAIPFGRRDLEGYVIIPDKEGR